MKTPEKKTPGLIMDSPNALPDLMGPWAGLCCCGGVNSPDLPLILRTL